MPHTSGTTLFTGYPGFIGRRLVHRMLEEPRRGRLVLLVEPAQAAVARAELGRHDAGEVEVWEGDVSAMHLGLSGAEWKSLVRDVSTVWHLAGASRLDSGTDIARSMTTPRRSPLASTTSRRPSWPAIAAAWSWRTS
jgi:nucleoside-diphosphate-sugar epimerase